MVEYSKMSDEELVESARHFDDEKAVDELIIRFLPVAQIVASKFSGVPIERDDLIQEGMLGFLNGIYTYSPNKKTSVKQYLQICIRRKILNAIKACNRKKDFPRESIVPLEEEFLDNSFSSNTPEDFVIGKERFNSLNVFIEEKLTELEKKVLKLHVSGASYAEISKRLSITVKAVDNALHRVRNKLKKFVL